ALRPHTSPLPPYTTLFRSDRPVAALIRDLKRRGLLDSTLVIWGGEFGRTSMNEARGGSKLLGRDHHPHCFTIWLAGAGIKGGVRSEEHTSELQSRFDLVCR